MQLSFSVGEYLKIGYEIGDRYFEEQGIFLGQEGDMLMLDVGDGETASIKDSKIVSIRRMKRSQEPASVQTPASTAPEQPAAETPQPAAVEPPAQPAADQASAAKKAEPAAVEPPAQSVTEMPQPAAEQSAAAESPQPAAETPQPAAETPQPAAETPQPTAEQASATLTAAQPAVIKAAESVELLQEGYRYDFESEVQHLTFLTEVERKQWLELFDRQDYQRLSQLVKETVERRQNSVPNMEIAHSQEASVLRRMQGYLAETQERYVKNTLINDGSWLYRGMIAIGVERNVSRAYRFFMTSVKTETAHLKTAVYRCAVLYSIAGNQPRAVEICKELIQYARKIEPAFDQCVCWKVMLEIFKNGEEWENYSECLFHLAEASYEHVRACINSIAKFTPELVRHGFYEDALELYRMALDMGLGNGRIYLHLLYLEWKRDPQGELAEKVRLFAGIDSGDEEWVSFRAGTCAGFLQADDRDRYFQEQEDESISATKPQQEKKKEAVIEDDNTYRQEYEDSFYRQKLHGNPSQLKNYVNQLAQNRPNNTQIGELGKRVDIYMAQMGNMRKITTPSNNYERGLEAWFRAHDSKTAAEFFMAAIRGNDTDQGTAILTYVDMIAVEEGLLRAVEVMSTDMREYIRNCERQEKIAFYEKKYDFSFLLKNWEYVMDSLNILQNLYYSKTQLGKTYFRIAECNFEQGRWKQAKDNYEKAIDYGYMRTLCESKRNQCRRNLGEDVSDEGIFGEEGNLPGSEEAEVSVELVRKRVEQFYDEIKYRDANNYVQGLLRNNSDNEELRELAEQTAEVVRNMNNTPTMPTRMDSQAAGLRAWHIEKNYEKAQKKFLEAISQGGDKALRSLMDLSEMLMHAEGAAAGIECLKKHEYLVRRFNTPEQTGYYEKMYLMQQKVGDKEEMLASLKQLLEIYSKLKRRDKVGFTYFRMGMVRYQMGDYEQAIARMRDADSNGYHTTACQQCIAMSYVGLGQYEDARGYVRRILNQNYAKQDSNLTNRLNGILEQIDLLEKGGTAETGSESQIGSGSRILDMTIELENKLESFYLDEQTFPALAEDETETLTGKNVLDVLEHTEYPNLRERAAALQRVAFQENRVNGKSQNYYRLLADSVGSWGGSFQNGEIYDCAYSCRIFEMETAGRLALEKRSRYQDEATAEALACIVRQKANPDEKGKLSDGRLREFVWQVLEQETDRRDYAMREFLFLAQKSFVLDRFMQTQLEKEENGRLWLEQIGNYLGESKNVPKDYRKLFRMINERVKNDGGRLSNLVAKIRNSKGFQEEVLTELKDAKNKIFVLETDCNQYLRALVEAYEKALEIYDYEDYDNRMATISMVQKMLVSLSETIIQRPTYFSVNYVGDIIEYMQDILRTLSKSTREDFGPVISIHVPITEAPVVDGKQSISITVSNKDNSASATNLFLAAYSLDGRTMVESQPLAQYLRGGKSVSKEIILDSLGENYTIRIEVNYIDHEGRAQKEEQSLSISAGGEQFEQIENPYFNGNAIGVENKDVFFGRDALLDRLELALRTGKSNCEIIFGQKRCGKSSIANFLEDRLKDTFFVVKLSIGAGRNTAVIYNEIKETVIEGIWDYIDCKGEDDKINESLIEKLEQYDVSTEELFDSFIRTVKRTFCAPTNRAMLLMLDEFTHLYRYVKEDRRMVADFMDNWKKLMEANLFKAVLIGQDTMPYFLKEFPNQFQVTSPIRIDMLDDKSSKQLIEEPIRLPNGESRFLENSAGMIAEWFHGQPFYIQSYCVRLVDQMNQDRKVRVTNALAEKVKRIMLEEEDKSKFDNLYSRGDESGTEDECFEILSQIAALTKNSEWADAEELHSPNLGELMADLTERGVVERMGARVKIRITFFKEWLNLHRNR